jgi:SAM-dependent methyltransferase
MNDAQVTINGSADDVAPMRAAQLAALKLVLATVGRLSAGVRTGWRTGFDSGESLDHAYRNVPEGFTPIGRWLDRVYLDATGWRAVRRRRLALAALLESTLGDLGRPGHGAYVLDIAAGVGRYVLELMHARPDLGICAELRDRDAGSLAAGRALADRLGLTDARFVAADAFAPDLRPRTTPTVVIVSGLYELFSDNALVAGSLRAVRDALAADGALLYTNQPWHPQLDLIARVLVTREGRPWVMRCRPQAELDALVAAAGFRKETMVVDDEGIFTVSRATKVGA